MSLIEFQDYPSTGTPLNAENLNHNFNEITALIETFNEMKTITLNGQWMYAVAVSGGGTRLRLPIFNPGSLGVKLVGLTGEYFSGSGWVSVTNLQVSSSGKTFVELSMDAGDNTQNVLVRLYGTIQVS